MAKAEFVELLKGRMAAREASFDLECKDLEARLAEAKSLPDVALTEMMAQGDRLRNEVDHLSSVRRTLSVDAKKARRELSSARAEVGLLRGQATTNKRSTEEAEQRASDVQYELDGALVRVT